MYIVSNKYNVFGAAGIISKKVLDMAKEKVGDNFIILPSSIHEVLVVPGNSVETKDLHSMVGDINENTVADKEVLSNSVYRYQDGGFVIASK